MYYINECFLLKFFFCIYNIIFTIVCKYTIDFDFPLEVWALVVERFICPQGTMISFRVTKKVPTYTILKAFTLYSDYRNSTSCLVSFKSIYFIVILDFKVTIN